VVLRSRIRTPGVDGLGKSTKIPIRIVGVFAEIRTPAFHEYKSEALARERVASPTAFGTGELLDYATAVLNTYVKSVIGTKYDSR
jgi:hypothetical protein